MVESVKNIDTVTPESVKSRKSIVELIHRMKKMFAVLDVDVIESTEGFNSHQKAKITTNPETGKVNIVLNTAKGNYTDLIHENLHIYLTLLRLNNMEVYDELIKQLVETHKPFLAEHSDKTNFAFIEEYLVDRIVALTDGKDSFLYTDLKAFMFSLAGVIKEHINKEYVFDYAKLVNDPITLLKENMRDIYGINDMDNSHSMYNMSFIASEPFLRD